VLDLGCGQPAANVYLLAEIGGGRPARWWDSTRPPQLRWPRPIAISTPSASATPKTPPPSPPVFLEGTLETLGELPLVPASLRSGGSNCVVVNLCTDKLAVLGPGCGACSSPVAEFYFADVYADPRVREALLRDPVALRRMPAAAPLYWSDFQKLARRAGFPRSAPVATAAGDPPIQT